MRKLYRKLFPGSMLAREFNSRLANLHSVWHKIMTDVLVRASLLPAYPCMDAARYGRCGMQQARSEDGAALLALEKILARTYEQSFPDGCMCVAAEAQARGEVAEDDVSLWGCLAKVRDVKTGALLTWSTHARSGLGPCLPKRSGSTPQASLLSCTATHCFSAALSKLQRLRFIAYREAPIRRPVAG
jgi:hypothetical protein